MSDKPYVLTEREREIHRRYTAMGFKISARPFAGRDNHPYFFMMLPSVENPKGIEFTINLHSGIAHRTGTHSIWDVDQAEACFGTQLVANAQPQQERTVAPPPAKAETVQQQTETAPFEAEKPAESVRRERPAAVAESGKATAVASPVKPVKKKQTSLF